MILCALKICPKTSEKSNIRSRISPILSKHTYTRRSAFHVPSCSQDSQVTQTTTMQSIDYCIGPLTRIRILGTICPCLLSEEDALANSTYKSLSKLLYKKITYHKPPPPPDTDSTPSSSSSKSFFQTFTGMLSGTDDATPSTEKWEKIEAKIHITGLRNTISMEIIPCDGLHNDISADESDDDDSETKALAKKMKAIIIPLHKIGVVSAGSAQMFNANSTLIQVYGKQSQHNPSGKGDEILRISLEEGVDRVEFIDLFMNLIHWYVHSNIIH